MSSSFTSVFTSALIPLVVSIPAFPLSAMAANWFEDVTTSSGIQYTGSSYGASWGDWNGDGWPDLWVGNHSQAPSLFQNNKDGTFARLSNQIPKFSLPIDMHGAAWADFDNDGDQDLLIETGAHHGTGQGPNIFLVNANEALQDRAASYGLDYPLGRGRTPLWLDWNADGNLDVLLVNEQRTDGAAPTALFSQLDNGFLDSFPVTGLNTSISNSFAQTIHLNNMIRPILLIDGSRFTDRAYDIASTPFVDLNIGSVLFPGWLLGVSDIAIGDINGDLLSDIFLARSKAGSEILLDASGQILARLNILLEEKGFSFNSVEDINVEINTAIQPGEIFIGEQGIHPARLAFTLSASDPDVIGMAAHEPAVDRGVYISHVPATGQWTFLVSTNTSRLDLILTVTTNNGISDVTTIGLETSDNGARTDTLFLQTDGGFVDRSAIAGVDSLTRCISTVAADFDNDMDIDLYLVCSGQVSNHDNILYENTGNGVFRRVANGGGAAGSTKGLADSVAAADFDNDGFIDLFVTNGAPSLPIGFGPSQLFRNVGNNNHWLEIDLVGTVSNRDGIGSRVLVTAGGITQLREQNGGGHLSSQNHQRLHFGLGTAESIDKIEIEWPSGIQQTLIKVRSDQVINIVEQNNENNAPTIGESPSTTVAQGGGGSGGGGCVIDTTAGKDPVFPLILVFALIHILRKHYRQYEYLPS